MHLAGQLRFPPTTRNYLAQYGERYEGAPPWDQGDGGAQQPQQGLDQCATDAAPSSSSGAWLQHAQDQPEDPSDTDTASLSSAGRSLDYNVPEFQGFSEMQIDEQLFSAYVQAKKGSGESQCVNRQYLHAEL